MSETPQGPGWWQASDLRWYPPEQQSSQPPPPGGLYRTEPSQATTALVLGILGLVLCGVLAPIAWSIGSKEIAAIDAGRRDPTGRGTANAGRILGIIGTVFLAVGVAAVILFGIAVAAGST